jgi:excisionase family DNA binding protein
MSAQMADLLQMKRSTIEDYARRGLLPSIKLGRHRRFVRADVEATLARLRRGGAEQTVALL